jgi:hypothetical protein
VKIPADFFYQPHSHFTVNEMTSPMVSKTAAQTNADVKLAN